MLNTEKKAPQAHGGGSLGSLSGQKFTMIPMDEMTEMAINKSSKVIGGLSGVTENKSATERWM